MVLSVSGPPVLPVCLSRTTCLPHRQVPLVGTRHQPHLQEIAGGMGTLFVSTLRQYTGVRLRYLLPASWFSLIGSLSHQELRGRDYRATLVSPLRPSMELLLLGKNFLTLFAFPQAHQVLPNPGSVLFRVSYNSPQLHFNRWNL